MRRFFLLELLGALFGMIVSATAQTEDSLHPSSLNVKNALNRVVSQQLQAFQAGDFTKAYTFAADEIRTLFAPDAFEKMVKEGYPVMLAKARPDFGTALDDGQDGVLFMELTDAGGTQIFRYSFKMEGGQWKISGVTRVEAKPDQPSTNTA